jgi:hypothetical protein
MKIDFYTTSAGHVNWRDGETLEYKAVKSNMAEFRGMVGQLQQATCRALLEDLMFRPMDKAPRPCHGSIFTMT